MQIRIPFGAAILPASGKMCGVGTGGGGGSEEGLQELQILQAENRRREEPKMKLYDAINIIDGFISKANKKDQTVANVWLYIRQFVIDFEWRDAEVEIPPDQEEVLVLTQSKNGVRNIDKGYWAIDHFIHRGRARVTHWMPLPKKPESEK